ncbi:type II toxin-antitoxin system VapC family toxin [Magnetovirga frankeli]|uniref:type II toxin-antitoxin system VapC family toxin n=1 Tax=Magnetovirga frankeli TaxID=947516 RepID=UPI001AF6D506|nr:type II toxin-antitoxin system VapC family toxin [gamma proteobacterium SS-5]
MTEADSQRYIGLLERLNIITDQATAAHALSETLNLARRYNLSAYDASYLELALRTCRVPPDPLYSALESNPVHQGGAHLPELRNIYESSQINEVLICKAMNQM